MKLGGGNNRWQAARGKALAGVRAVAPAAARKVPTADAAVETALKETATLSVWPKSEISVTAVPPKINIHSALISHREPGVLTE